MAREQGTVERERLNQTMTILRLDHVGIAVRDLAPAMRLWGDLLGGEYRQGVPDHHGFAFLHLSWPGGGRLEFISPSSDGTGFLQRFLDGHGEGMHHMTFITDDLRAEVERFRAEGYRVVDEDYRDPHWQEAFLSPRGAHGCLIQLVESDLDQAGQDAEYRPMPLDRVLEMVERARAERDAAGRTG